MKKHILLIALMGLTHLAMQAQNIQLHYDFGRHIYQKEEPERPNATLTFELFKADKIGSWYYFIDIDADKKGFAGAYTELSREFNIGKKGFAAHMEVDGGLNRGGSFQYAVLAGPSWNGHTKDYSTTYSVQMLYKQYFGQPNGPKSYASFQLTGVWSTTFAKGHMTFNGYADLWLGRNAEGKPQLAFGTEPQLWYNPCKVVSIGTEVEITNNFIYNPYTSRTFFVNPTLAIKFNL